MCPQIPLETPLIQANAEGPNIPQSVLRREGAIGQAVGEVGNEVYHTADQLNHQVKEQEAQASVATSSLNGIADGDKKMAALKIAYPTGYVKDAQGNYDIDPVTNQRRTIADEYQDWAQERFQSDYLNQPSDIAQRAYQERMGQYFSSETNKLRADAPILALNYAKQSVGVNLQKACDDLVSAPNLASSYLKLSIIQAQIKDLAGIYRNEAAWRQMSESATSELGKNYFDGLLTQLNSTTKTMIAGMPDRGAMVQQALDILDGKDRNSGNRKPAGQVTWADALKPEDKFRIREKLTGMKEVASAQDKAENSIWTQALIDQGKSGRAIDPGEYVRWRAQQIRLGIEPLQDAKNMRAIGAGVVEGSLTKSPSFLLAPYGDRPGIISEAAATVNKEASSRLPPGMYPSIETDDREMQSNLNAFSTKVATAQTTDFPQSLKDYEYTDRAVSDIDKRLPTDVSKMGDFAQDIQTKIDRIKTDYKLVFGEDKTSWRGAGLSLQDSKDFGKQLTSTEMNEAGTVFAVKSLKKAYGSYFPDLIDQMIKDHTLTPSWRIVGAAGSDDAMAALVSSAKGGGVARKDFDTFLKQDSNDYKRIDFDRANNKNLAPFTQGYMQAFPGDYTQEQIADNFREAVKNQAATLFQKSAGQKSPRECADDAFKEIIGENFYVNKPSNGWFSQVQKAPILVPTFMDGNKITPEKNEQLQNFFKKDFNAEEAGVGAKDAKNDVAYRKQVETTGYWKVSPDYKGFNRMYIDIGGHPKVVESRDGNTMKPYFVPVGTALKDSEGYPSAVPRKFVPQVMNE